MTSAAADILLVYISYVDVDLCWCFMDLCLGSPVSPAFSPFIQTRKFVLFLMFFFHFAHVTVVMSFCLHLRNHPSKNASIFASGCYHDVGAMLNRHHSAVGK